MSRADSVKVLRRSSHAMTPSHQQGISNSVQMSPVPDNEADQSMSVPYGARRNSVQFVVPGNFTPDVQRGDSNRGGKLVRTLTEKLDKNSKSGGGGFEAETSFGDLTSLYFIIMRRYSRCTLYSLPFTHSLYGIVTVCMDESGDWERH